MAAGVGWPLALMSPARGPGGRGLLLYFAPGATQLPQPGQIDLCSKSRATCVVCKGGLWLAVALTRGAEKHSGCGPARSAFVIKLIAGV